MTIQTLTLYVQGVYFAAIRLPKSASSVSSLPSFDAMASNLASSDKPISESSSRCLTECLSTAHNFEIIRFSLLEGMGAGKFISSSKFRVGGYDWKIRIYPDGWKEEDKAAYMSVFLCFCSRPARDAKVKFTLSLWGWREFIEKPKLQELLSVNDDCFTIRCVLTVIKEPHTEDVSTVVVPVPESNLHAHFANMLKDGKGVDVKFSVGGQLFSAHRCVLAARSPVFKAKLYGQMKETTMKCVKIDDMEPSVFKALLHFIYTDSLAIDVQLKLLGLVLMDLTRPL